MLWAVTVTFTIGHLGTALIDCYRRRLVFRRLLA